MQQFDVIVIGGGIVGLAHAWMATERGLNTLLIERTGVAQGASVRNFGMVWPIGQPSGEMYSLALRSRQLWLKLHELGAIQAETCGSIHVAHQSDEMAVLEEFCGSGKYDVQLLTREQVLARAPIVNPAGLLGGMWSAMECRVDPRVASAQIADFLQRSRGLTAHFQTAVSAIEGQTVYTTSGQSWNGRQIIVCSGSDLQTLFPEVLQSAGLRLCKLQMLRVKQSPLSKMMPHIASGLTLRHYTSFAHCPSLQSLKSRVASESPELDRYGIHVMASAFPSGDILLGDSHEYDADITPFDKSEIDELMIRELRKILDLPDWTIDQRWHGIYAKHPQLPVVHREIRDGICCFVGTGGNGMTMSFGLAEQAWAEWMGEAK